MTWSGTYWTQNHNNLEVSKKILVLFSVFVYWKITA